MVKCFKGRSNFRGSVHVFEALLLALSHQGKSRCISLEVVRLKRDTAASQLKEISNETEGWAFVVNILRSVKCRDTLATKLTRKEVLMVVNEDSDTIVTKLVDKGLDLVQVAGVIDSG